MSDNQKKRYYWLKLKDDFFDNPMVKVLEKQKNGYAYEVFLLKLMLKSVAKQGLLRLNEAIPYNEDMLSAVTDMDIDTVRVGLKALVDLGFIEVMDNGTLFMSQVQDLIGSETNGAAYRRGLRRAEREQLADGMTMSSFCHQDIEIDKDKDIDINKYSPVSQEKTEHLSKEIFEVISYLNEKTGCRYRESNKKNQSLIKARLNEGFTVDDFKKVIDNKVAEWGNDPKMNQYLRPVTLFGTKFESYLNQKPVVEERVMSKENADFLAAIMDD